MGKPAWSDPIPETLSAFMDGETPEDAQGQLLKALETDPELQRRWSSYHLVSDAIRNNLPPILIPDLGARIHRDLESEPAYLLPRQYPGRRPARATQTEQPAKRTPRQVIRHAVKQAGGLALAASVTAATILGVQAFNAGTAPTGATLAGADGGIPVSAQGSTSQASTPMTMTSYSSRLAPRQPPPQLINKFNHMLANHNAYVSGTPVRGVPAYVRLVNFEGGR